MPTSLETKSLTRRATVTVITTEDTQGITSWEVVNEQGEVIGAGASGRREQVCQSIGAVVLREGR